MVNTFSYCHHNKAVPLVPSHRHTHTHTKYQPLKGLKQHVTMSPAAWLCSRTACLHVCLLTPEFCSDRILQILSVRICHFRHITGLTVQHLICGLKRDFSGGGRGVGCKRTPRWPITASYEDCYTFKPTMFYLPFMTLASLSHHPPPHLRSWVCGLMTNVSSQLS